MRLARAQKIQLLDLASASSLRTTRWREFLLLSRKGLVDIERPLPGDVFLSKMFGGEEPRAIVLTEKGRAEANQVAQDDGFLNSVSTEHQAQRTLSGPAARGCPCGACCFARQRTRGAR